MNRFVLALALVLSSAPAFAQGTFESRTIQGRRVKVYRSSKAQGRPPLVLMLHGCTQDPDQFARGTRMNAVAEERGWLVAYPEQPASANRNGCWNWFLAEHQGRGRGEPALLAAIADEVVRSEGGDPARVYVAGLSAGAAMSVILGATYPDRFAAIGVVAGLEFGAATSVTDAFAAMRTGGPAPERQGEVAFRAMGPRARVVPALVFHGKADHTVAPVNGEQVAKQWLRTNELAGATGVTPGTRAGTGALAFTTTEHRDASGRLVVSFVQVEGMGHAWPGGDVSGSYTEPRGPDASRLLAEFFAKSSGTPSPAPTPTPTPSPSPCPCPAGSTVTLASRADQDGSVGPFLAIGVGPQPVAGDRGMFAGEAHRAILAFDATGLPPSARVVGLRLRVARASLEGTVSELVVDVKEGWFGAGPELALDDWSAPASISAAARFAPPASDGAWAEVELPPATHALLAKGYLQVRIRAVTPVGFAPNRLVLAGGEDAARAPHLVVTHR